MGQAEASISRPNEGEEQHSLKLQILERVQGLVTAGFGLVAALAWNDAIQSLFIVIFGQQSSVVAKFAYALIVTILVVMVTLRISRLIAALKKRTNAATG